MGALLLRDAVDVLDVAADGEDALPARHGVGAHDGVDGLELGADVGRVAARLVPELEAVLGRRLAETGLLKGHAEALEELLVRPAELVVDFVSRRKQRVYSQNILASSSLNKKQIARMGKARHLPPPLFGSCESRREE